jgi:hypothetical protein
MKMAIKPKAVLLALSLLFAGTILSSCAREACPGAITLEEPAVEQPS